MFEKLISKKRAKKYIVVTGGVISGLGKGIAAASIGHLLSEKLKVVPIKCDGYLNIDPGTMNPIEHGEVFVLDDGGEVDMDFGHYERFLNITCKFEWNLTMGKVYRGVLDKERRGDYLGKTVQLIPHVTNYIKESWMNIAKKENADIALIEIGGTIGDIENELYVEAARQLSKDAGKENVIYVHLTYIPIPMGVNEQKSKPTQQSVSMLNQRGIYPDIIVGRCSQPITDSIKEKIARMCNIEKDAVVTGLDVDTVYKIPIVFYKENILKTINKKFKLNIKPNLKRWANLVSRMNHKEFISSSNEIIKTTRREVNIAICGKYTALEDSYASVVEALMHTQAHFNCKVNIKWIDTTNCSYIKAREILKGIDGVIVPGGFGDRGVEGKINVIRYVRENNIPFLGLCYGLQLAVVEYARNVCGLSSAHTTECNDKTDYPVIDILPEQKEVTCKGGTMRLGAYVAHVKEGTLVHKLYGSKLVSERHRHRYEVNPEYHEVLGNKGLIISGASKDGKLVEFVELQNHPYFVATQAHPELKSSLLRPAPLFRGLVGAALRIKENK
ncbi:MAG: CTP synthase (glutamine hydrolyzing) [Candidatus Woesearchaeota archaeon]|jgi:CTP synthase